MLSNIWSSIGTTETVLSAIGDIIKYYLFVHHERKANARSGSREPSIAEISETVHLDMSCYWPRLRFQLLGTSALLTKYELTTTRFKIYWNLSSAEKVTRSIKRSWNHMARSPILNYSTSRLTNVVTKQRVPVKRTTECRLLNEHFLVIRGSCVIMQIYVIDTVLTRQLATREKRKRQYESFSRFTDVRCLSTTFVSRDVE